MKSIFSVLLFILVIAILSGAWWWLDNNQPETQVELREVPITHVIVTEVFTDDVQQITKTTGRLVPARSTKLHFEVSGQVAKRDIEAGQKVTAGEALIQIGSGDFDDVFTEMQIQLEQEQVAIERDKKLLGLVNRQATLLQREVNRLEKLKKQSLTSQSKIDETRRSVLRERSEQEQLKHSVQTSESRLKMRQVALQKAQRNVERTTLVAPFSGTVNAVNVSVGDYVSPGQSVLELVQIEELDLNVEVAGKDISALEMGQSVAVVIDSSEHQGKLTSIQYDPNPVSHTHALKIRLSGAGLFPGQLGQVQLKGKLMKGALLVPTTAVLREDGKSFIFQVHVDVLVRTAVETIGRQNNNYLVVGVKAGDKIVARDVAALEDGQQVVTD